jgi:hypothetical protein
VLYIIILAFLVSGCASGSLSPPQGVHLDVTVFYVPQWKLAQEAKRRGLIAQDDVFSAASVRGFYDQDRKEIWTLEGEIPESLMAAGHELRHAVDDELGRASFHGNMIVDLHNWRSVNAFVYPSSPLSFR